MKPEGEGSGQYGEDRILKLVFKDQPAGLVVDVGAADGYWNSNSIMLLQRPLWRGVLVEPEPVQYEQLTKRYQHRPDVVCCQYAIGKQEGTRTLWCGGQSSTLKDNHKRASEEAYGIEFTSTQVKVITLTKMLKMVEVDTLAIDFLSIDAEGMNYEVWQTLDIKRFAPRLVCIEGKGYAMHGYRELCQMPGNTFYMREDICNQL